MGNTPPGGQDLGGPPQNPNQKKEEDKKVRSPQFHSQFR